MNILEVFENCGLFSFIDIDHIKVTEPSKFYGEDYLEYKKKQDIAHQIELLVYNGGVKINGDRIYVSWDQDLGSTYIVDGTHIVTVEKISNLSHVKTKGEYRKYQIVINNKELIRYELLEER